MATQSAGNAFQGEDSSRVECARNDNSQGPDHDERLGSDDNDSLNSDDDDTPDIDENEQACQDDFDFELASDDMSLGWSDFEADEASGHVSRGKSKESS